MVNSQAESLINLCISYDIIFSCIFFIMMSKFYFSRLWKGEVFSRYRQQGLHRRMEMLKPPLGIHSLSVLYLQNRVLMFRSHSLTAVPFVFRPALHPLLLLLNIHYGPLPLQSLFLKYLPAVRRELKLKRSCVGPSTRLRRLWRGTLGRRW